MSIESIASPPSSADTAEPCAACGAPLDDDQRYCLQCGERRAPLSSALLGAGASGAPSPPVPPPAPPAPPSSFSDGNAGRGSAVTVIAGVGVLLLAMGIGVLIGRSGASKPGAAPAQVISVAQATGSAQGSGATPALATFSDDWPAGSSGYTVQLQTLPQASTQVSAVLAAKSAAGTKGAKHVGALKSEDFAGLPTGNYVVYSGEYHKRAEANRALAGLRKSFPAAKVIKVSSAGSGAAAASPGAGAGSPGSSPTTGVGSSESHPAPPAVLKKKLKSGTKNSEQESLNLPNVISTG